MSTFLRNGLYQIVKDPNAYFNKNQKSVCSRSLVKIKNTFVGFYQNKG